MLTALEVKTSYSILSSLNNIKKLVCNRMDIDMIITKNEGDYNNYCSVIDSFYS